MTKKLTKKNQKTSPETEKPPVETAEADIKAPESNIDAVDETADSNTAPETTPDNAGDSNTEKPATATKPTKSRTKRETDSGKEAATMNQCPKCQHVSSTKAIKLGGVNRAQCFIEIDGVAYHNVESQRIMCERCKQIHFVKTYR